MVITKLALACLLGYVLNFNIAFSESAFIKKPKPEHISNQAISTSICTDTYLLSLNNDPIILALSWQYDHPLSILTALTPFEKQQFTLPKPKAWPSAERLYFLAYFQNKSSLSKNEYRSKPVIILDYTSPKKLENQLKRLKLPFIKLSYANRYSDVFDNLTKLGKALNQTWRVKQIIKNLSDQIIEMEKKIVLTEPHINNQQNNLLSNGKRILTSSDVPSFLYLNRAGITTGKQSFISHALEKAGGQNSIKKKIGFYTLSFEETINLKPDIIITSHFKRGYTSYSGKRTQHPVFQNLMEKAPMIEIPSYSVNCANPFLIKASTLFYQAIQSEIVKKNISHLPERLENK